MILHLHRIEVVQEKLSHAFDYNRVVTIEEGLLSVDTSGALDVIG